MKRFFLTGLLCWQFAGAAQDQTNAPALCDTSAAIGAPLVLGRAFGDHMVFQRGVPVRIFGTATPGASVSVTFGWEKTSVNADATGRWLATLPAMPANTNSRILSVTDGKESKFVNDVLVGEIWIAAGQSNMEWPLAREAHAATELPAAANASLRLLNLPFAGQYFFSRPFGSNELARMTSERFYSGAWRPCSPESAKDFSAIAYYFGREVQRELDVPVGIIHLAVGGSPTEAWIRRAALAGDPELRAMAQGNWLTNAALDDWCRERGHQNLDAGIKFGLPVPGDDLGPNHHFKPGFLWSAGPARLLPFAIRGVIWYQGESNSLDARRVSQHEKLFPLLVRDWRAAWNKNIPFLFCQLSSIRTNKYKSAFWPEFRDQQRRFMDMPNTGMVVTSDIGALDDVHPRNKREVGRRLALWALADTYGKADEFSGPLPESVRGGSSPELTVLFSHGEGMKASRGGALRGFEIAGADGVFHPAQAVVSGNKIIVSAAGVSHPVTVRYGWQPFSEGNLVNDAGLPASTFSARVKR